MVNPPRRDAIVKHVARYGVTLRPVLERLFNADGTVSIDADLKVLRDEGLLTAVPYGVQEPTDTRTKYSYYYLTRKACAAIGAPDSRARQPGGYALERSLAILWFCCMTRNRAHRLNDDEVADLFSLQNRKGSEARIKHSVTGFHCLARGRERFQVINLYATKANTRDTLSELKKRLDDSRRIAAVAEAIRSQEYVFALLVETSERAAELREEIAKQLGREGFVFKVFCSPRSWRPLKA